MPSISSVLNIEYINILFIIIILLGPAGLLAWRSQTIANDVNFIENNVLRKLLGELDLNHKYLTNAFNTERYFV